jgi:hypothetical protein
VITTDIVKDIIPLIQEKATYFRYVREGVYVTRCPECGDTQSNQRTGHCYLLINENGCTCYCHKCNWKSQMNDETLEKFIGPHDIKLSTQHIRRINPSNPSMNVETDVLKKDSPQYRYLKWRIGTDFTPDEMHNMRIIDDQQAFIDKYNIKGIHVVRNAITFVTPDGNTLCYRNMTENDDWRWIKKNVYQKYDSTPYTFRTAYDVLSPEPQLVIITEGVFDLLGVYKHIISSANLYVATLGQDYAKAIRWLISKGIVGKNVQISIYSDSNVSFDKYRMTLRKYKWMYNSISVVYNDGDEDFGFPKDHIIPRDPRNI